MGVGRCTLLREMSAATHAHAATPTHRPRTGTTRRVSRSRRPIPSPRQLAGRSFSFEFLVDFVREGGTGVQLLPTCRAMLVDRAVVTELLHLERSEPIPRLVATHRVEHPTVEQELLDVR